MSLLFGTGVITWFSGGEGSAWVFVAHDIAGAALAILLGWKLRRVAGRVLDPGRWDRRTSAGLLGLALVAATLFSGWAWSTFGNLHLSGYTLLAWHSLLGVLLTVAVAVHLGFRAPAAPASAIRRAAAAPRGRRDRARGRDRVAGAAPAPAAFGLARRRPSLHRLLQADSFAGNAFRLPPGWLTIPRRSIRAAYRLERRGRGRSASSRCRSTSSMATTSWSQPSTAPGGSIRSSAGAASALAACWIARARTPTRDTCGSSP